MSDYCVEKATAGSHPSTNQELSCDRSIDSLRAKTTEASSK